MEDEVLAIVRDRVAYDDERDDPWHGPTYAAKSAAYVCSMVHAFLIVGWKLPMDLLELWAWYEAGHWPSQYDGADSGRLLVLCAALRASVAALRIVLAAS